MAALALGSVVGCKDQNAMVGGKKPKYLRVVSLSPSTTELLGITGDNKVLVGRTAACNYPLGTTNIEIMTIGPKPDYELLALRKPDAIVYDKALYSDDDIAKIKQLKADVFEYNPHNLTEMRDQAAKLFGMTQVEIPGWSYLDRVNLEIEEAKKDPITPAPSVAILMTSPGSNPMIAGTNSFYADLIEKSGGKLVGPTGDKFVSVNPEELIKLNPDVIVTAGDPNGFDKDPRFASLKAIQGKRIFGIKSDVILRIGGRVDVAIKNIHKILKIK